MGQHSWAWAKTELLHGLCKARENEGVKEYLLNVFTRGRGQLRWPSLASK